MTELMLRRSMAENPLAFDLMREHWRRQMRVLCPQPKRHADGRFAR